MKKLDYQKEKLLYHFNRCKSLGMSNESIITYLMTAQQEPEKSKVHQDMNKDNENEEKHQSTLETLIGYIKYPKKRVVNDGGDLELETTMMFVKEGETNSSIYLIDYLSYNLPQMEVLQKYETEKTLLIIEAKKIGETSTGKPKMLLKSLREKGGVK